MTSAFSRRAPGLLLALFGAALVAVTISLDPDPRGHGTHEQLGLPPCTFLAGSNVPCPTCGVTTAFTLVVHGRPLDAVRTQPFGALLGALALLLPVLFVASALAPSLDPAVLVARSRPTRIAAVLALAALAAWVFRFF